MGLQNVQVALRVIEPLGIPFMLTAEIEMMGTMLDSTTAEAFVDFARGYPRARVGISAEYPTLLTEFDVLRKTSKLPDTAFVNVFRPECLAELLR